jgi:hypothetical protein
VSHHHPQRVNDTETWRHDMANEWPTDPDDPVDPALAPLIEAGEGESEGFELAEEELIENASHGDQHSDRVAGRDALGFDSPEEDPATYGEADEEDVPG